MSDPGPLLLQFFVGLLGIILFMGVMVLVWVLLSKIQDLYYPKYPGRDPWNRK